MLALYLGSCEACLRAAELRRLLQDRHRLWVWVGDAEMRHPFLRQSDAIEIVDDGEARGGLAVIDQQGQVTVPVMARHATAPALGWVRQIWRGGRRYRLDRTPWRQLLWLGASRQVWRCVDRSYGLVWRARCLMDQVRPSPNLPAVEKNVAHAYSLPSRVEFYVGQAHSGLWESEQVVLDRYLKVGDHVLDIGCGVGREAFGFARHGLRVTAVDTSAAFVAEALREREALPGGCDVAFEVLPLSRLDFPTATFDAVFLASDVYSCIPGCRHRIAILERCRHMLRSDGFVIFPVHIPPGARGRDRRLTDGPRRTARRLFGERVPEDGDRWSRFGPEEGAPLLFKHYFASADDVCQEIMAAGLTVIDRISDFFVARSPHRAVPEQTRLHGRRYQAHGDVLTESLDDQLLLVHLTQAATYQLNGTGSAIWELAVQGHSVAEIAERLFSEFGVSREQLRSEASELLEELARSALLEERKESSR